MHSSVLNLRRDSDGADENEIDHSEDEYDGAKILAKEVMKDEEVRLNEAVLGRPN